MSEKRLNKSRKAEHEHAIFSSRFQLVCGSVRGESIVGFWTEALNEAVPSLGPSYETNNNEQAFSYSTLDLSKAAWQATFSLISVLFELEMLDNDNIYREES